MKTQIGNKLFYDNFQMGAMAPERKEGEPPADEVMLVFTDKDNEEVHMFQVSPSQWQQYKNLVDQTIAGQKVMIPTTEDITRINR